MTAYPKAKLTFPPVDVDGDDADEDGEFVFEGDLDITIRTVSDYVMSGGSAVNSIIAWWYDEISDGALAGDGKRQEFYLDLGGGEHIVEVDGVSWQGSSNTWGDPSENSGTAANGTSESPIFQMQVLDRYCQLAEVDSRNPATLEVGEYSSDGVYGPLNVVVKEPIFTFNSKQSASVMDFSIVMAEAAVFDEAYDAEQRQE